MKLSIVVPVYNVKFYVRECVDTLIKQIEESDADTEIILVDDGSTDGSERICDDYEEKHNEYIRVIHKPNGGLLSARRAGFAVAKGEYIINCDSDDVLLPNALVNITQSLIKTNADVLFYNAELIMKDGDHRIWFENVFSNDKLSYLTKQQVWENYFSGYATVSMCCKAIRKRCLAPQKDYSRFGKINMGEDSLQSIEIYNNAESFAYLNIPVYGYRMSSGMTSNFDEKFYEQFKIVLSEILKNKEEIDLPDFNKQFSKKLFDIVGRSITQGRSTRKFGLKGETEYLSHLKNDELVHEFQKFYPQIRDHLQKSHRYVCDLLLKKRYKSIYMSLQIMNLLKRGQ